MHQCVQPHCRITTGADELLCAYLCLQATCDGSSHGNVNARPNHLWAPALGVHISRCQYVPHPELACTLSSRPEPADDIIVSISLISALLHLLVTLKASRSHCNPGLDAGMLLRWRHPFITRLAQLFAGAGVLLRQSSLDEARNRRHEIAVSPTAPGSKSEAKGEHTQPCSCAVAESWTFM